MSTSTPQSVMSELRERIARLESGSARSRAALPFDLAPIDKVLPGGGLALGALHEVAGGGNGAIDGAAAALFAAGIAARTAGKVSGKVLWCVTRQDLFAPALAQAGLAPDRVIYVEAGDDRGPSPSRRYDRRSAAALPLFAAAAARESKAVPEIHEPAVSLRPMTAGGEVVEDYGHVGLTLRDHPLSFLREELRARRIVTCAEAMAARDGRWLEAAGLVLVRQRPGSAKGVMFITLEDETGIANLVVWLKVFEKYRRIVLSAGMIGVYGRIQREGEVVHLVAHRLTDLSADLASVGKRDTAFPLPHGRGDEFHHGNPGLDPRGLSKGPRPRNIVDPYGHIDQIKVKTRDFR